jgi:hypothetical protein
MTKKWDKRRNQVSVPEAEMVPEVIKTLERHLTSDEQKIMHRALRKSVKIVRDPKLSE